MPSRLSAGRLHEWWRDAFSVALWSTRNFKFFHQPEFKLRKPINFVPLALRRLPLQVAVTNSLFKKQNSYTLASRKLSRVWDKTHGNSQVRAMHVKKLSRPMNAEFLMRTRSEILSRRKQYAFGSTKKAARMRGKPLVCSQLLNPHLIRIYIVILCRVITA